MPSPFPNLPPDKRGEVRTLRITSKALAGNPWNDPTHRDLVVYLPPGYDGDSERYPAILCLPGYAGTGEKLLARSLTEPSLSARIDRLVAAGKPAFIAVMPDCMTRLGGSQYVDSPSLGAYATHLVEEVCPLIDATLHTTGKWGVMGHSSGGFGALHLAMNHPGRFQAVACHAGDMGFDLCYLGDLAKALVGVHELGGLEVFVERFWSQHDPSPAALAALNLLAMSCAYSPEPGTTPIPARLPIDMATGEVDFSVLEAWRAFDPIAQLEHPARAAALRQLAYLYIDCGSRDEYQLQYGARRFVAALDRLGIPHAYEEFDGGHRGTRYRFSQSLPALARKLRKLK